MNRFSSGTLRKSSLCQNVRTMWMTELAMNTSTADKTTGSQRADRLIIFFLLDFEVLIYGVVVVQAEVCLAARAVVQRSEIAAKTAAYTCAALRGRCGRYRGTPHRR